VIQNGAPERRGDREAGRHAIGASEGELVILAVGSLIPRKNHEHLIRCLAAGGSGHERSWRLAIAGTGREMERLRSVARELAVDDRVRLLGPRDDIPDLLAGADIFALPSVWEGLPLALLEAMFAGKAIVASDVAGIPEAVDHGVEGLLVPPTDAAALSGALSDLLTSPELRLRLGNAARARAQGEFSMDTMTDAYERFYLGSQ
jgi:glycosyltransferase involved in cell wall biosynthesis